MTDAFTNMPGFSRRDGEAFCEDIPLREIARRIGTPAYVYSRAALVASARDWLDGIRGTPNRVFYAMKANSSLGILELFSSLGLGFDIVSGGELYRALRAGATGGDVVYSGVGKTRREIEMALEAGILSFNVESVPELERIQEIAAAAGRTASVSIRVNPNVDAKTHPYISTGLKNNKFGVAYTQTLALYKRAAALPNLRVSGIDCHIGSQITEIAPFLHAADRVLDLVEELRDNGIELDHIDFGGGLGIRYADETPPKAADLTRALAARCAERGFGHLPLFFEPGRSLVGRAGVLLMSVQYLKPGEARNFCIVDAAMSDMIRPTLYQAEMGIANCSDSPAEPARWDVVGPICESGDWLAKARTLSVRPDDVLAMTGAGAYGSSMSSTYNSRPRAAEVLVDGSSFRILRSRETYEDLVRNEMPL